MTLMRSARPSFSIANTENPTKLNEEHTNDVLLVVSCFPSHRNDNCAHCVTFFVTSGMKNPFAERHITFKLDRLNDVCIPIPNLLALQHICNAILRIKRKTLKMKLALGDDRYGVVAEEEKVPFSAYTRVDPLASCSICTDLAMGSVVEVGLQRAHGRLHHHPHQRVRNVICACYFCNITAHLI